MHLEVLTATGSVYRTANTDNPYQARNFILPLNPIIDWRDPYQATTPRGLRIRSSADLTHILTPSPKIHQEKPFQPTIQQKPERHEPAPQNPHNVTLRSLLKGTTIAPSLARRILRKKYGAKNVRYEWTKEEAPTVLKLLKQQARAST